MKLISKTIWPEIFKEWQANEEKNPGWIYTATVVKGWPDWESWRMFTADQLGLPLRDWSIHEFADPLQEIPDMLVGPFTGWQGRLPKPNTHSFADLMAIPRQYKEFNARPAIQNMIRAFPDQTLMTGLKRTDGRIVLIEGHHRATAVAIAAHDHQDITFTAPVRIALAGLTDQDDGLLDRVLARGSSREPPRS